MDWGAVLVSLRGGMALTEIGDDRRMKDTALFLQSPPLKVLERLTFQHLLTQSPKRL